MNHNSVICKFISDNPDCWEDVLTDKYKIKVKKEDSYAIFTYDFLCDFADPLVQEARGIIIDLSSLEVVCWPFRKFGNHFESYADDIDWSSARVLEKVDGSIIKLWFDAKSDKWQFSTNGMIFAENAHVNNELFEESFDDIIKTADNYKDIPFDSLDKTNTYIFELVSPKTQVVIKYPCASLYHIGTKSNITGKELEADIGIRKPQVFEISNLEDCVRVAANLNSGADKDVKSEGFVVVDKNYNRIKIKSPDYLVMNKLMQTHAISKKECVELILERSDDIEAICLGNPYLIPTFKFYEYKIAELKALANKMAIFARGLYKELDNDRGALARIISSHRLCAVGFAAIESDLSGEEILLSMQKRLLALLPDYELEDLRSLLLKK